MKDTSLCGVQMRHIIRKTAAALIMAFSASTAFAACNGNNLYLDLGETQQQKLIEHAEKDRYPSGLFYEAKKDNRRIIVIGLNTYNDPRNDKILAISEMFLKEAHTLYVYNHGVDTTTFSEFIKANNDLFYLKESPYLNERLSKETWDKFAKAAHARGHGLFVPVVMQPWTALFILRQAPCGGSGEGDHRLAPRLVSQAKALGLPVKSLEPIEAEPKFWDKFSEAEIIDQIETALQFEEVADDVETTYADLYFDWQPGLMRQYRVLKEFASYKNQGLSEARYIKERAEFIEHYYAERIIPWTFTTDHQASEGTQILAVRAEDMPGEYGLLFNLLMKGWDVKSIF